jgi:hypothetical protein
VAIAPVHLIGEYHLAVTRMLDVDEWMPISVIESKT